MIGKIKGTIEEVYGDRAYIATASGVSYLVFVTPSVASRIHQEVDLYTYFAVREDAQVLYGVDSHNEIVLFEKLLTVDGVGPKSAFQMLSRSSLPDIVHAATTSDLQFFIDMKGVGKKTAQKILIELSAWVGKDFDLSAANMSDEDTTVLQALEALGFEKQDSRQALKKLDASLSVEEKIKEAIKAMTKGNSKD